MQSQRQRADDELTGSFKFDDSAEYAQQNYQKQFQTYLDSLNEDKN